MSSTLACPRCRATTLRRIVRGRGAAPAAVSRAQFEALDQEEQGCLVFADSHHWRCKACWYSWIDPVLAYRDWPADEALRNRFATSEPGFQARTRLACEVMASRWRVEDAGLTHVLYARPEPASTERLRPGERGVAQGPLSPRGRIGPLTPGEFAQRFWREGFVPQWIDFVSCEARRTKLCFQVLVCGRYANHPDLLFYDDGGLAPFHLTSPTSG